MSKMTAANSPSANTNKSAGETSNTNTPDERSNVQFPWRLHELLTEAQTNGNDVIISWLPGTDAFKVHNKQRFTIEILPAYFNATKYKSFQRNLNLWGFETITEGPNKGGCYHALFLKGDRNKCHYMTRQKVKGNKPKEESTAQSLQKLSAQDVSVDKDSLSTLANLASESAPAVSSSIPTSLLIPPPSTATAPDLSGLSFPKKLHHILAQPEYNDCVRWTPDGRCIRVVDPFRFQERVAPMYFTHTSFSSFLVELESYGFKKTAHVGFHECYYHDLMVRGCHHLSKYMATPQESRCFVSEKPREDLELDPMFMSPPSLATPIAPASMAPSISHLSSFLPSHHQFASDHGAAALLSRRQLGSFGGPFSHLLAGGTGAIDHGGALTSLQLGSLSSSLLVGGGRRSSLPTGLSIGYPSLPGAEGSRSAITSFLANSQLGGVSSGNQRNSQ